MFSTRYIVKSKHNQKLSILIEQIFSFDPLWRGNCVQNSVPLLLNSMPHGYNWSCRRRRIYLRKKKLWRKSRSSSQSTPSSQESKPEDQVQQEGESLSAKEPEENHHGSCESSEEPSASKADPTNGIEDISDKEELDSSDMGLSQSTHSSDSNGTVHRRAFLKAYIRKSFMGKSDDECEEEALETAAGAVETHKRKLMEKCSSSSDSVHKNQRLDESCTSAVSSLGEHG